MTKTVRDQLHKIVDLFQSNNIPKAIKEVTFPPFDVPSNKWSLANRLIMFFSGSADARGFNQWKSTNRLVKKGAKAIFILAPSKIKKAACPSCNITIKLKANCQPVCPACGLLIQKYEE